MSEPGPSQHPFGPPPDGAAPLGTEPVGTGHGGRHGRGSGGSTRTRLLTAALLGVLAGVLSGVLLSWQLGVLLGWMVVAAVFIVWTWHTIWPMDARATATHVLAEDPGRRTFDLVVVLAALFSLAGVAILLTDKSSPGGPTVQAFISVAAIFLSWGTIQTVYTVRYAELYYTKPDGGVDFNSKNLPGFTDFAYLAITLGMTYQVSDTDLQTREIRATALRQGLLSFLFGTVIVATTINLVAGLAH